MKRASPIEPGWRYNVADPDAFVPPELLALDGRYACDRCDFLCERAELVELPEGFICPDCASETPTAHQN